MDGSNPTHKLQLSIILYGKARKEKENSAKSSFSQEPNPVDPRLSTPLVALAAQVPTGSLNNSSPWFLVRPVGRVCVVSR